ncbi:NlpC/P60 family protein [Jatrophihabitans sp.]|uniref:C40 family peptidase n=1 Tax=Jatrophihabitans sp. TaxID=1932789 RepID=UPI0030C66275|nr:hypothetical protein [Jatrophihabitans sp.]
MSAPTLSHARRDVGTVVVVLLVLGLLATMVAVAMGVTPQESKSSTIVFSVAAPYQPSPVVQQPVPTAVAAPVADVPAPEGNWTAERGVEIARRALQWLNWPYSFGAGNESGPTYGVAVDYASRNDGRVRGFDCSGLVLYAVGPWLRLVHDAATQYTEAGTVHPALSQLQPGDLLFWSRDGTINGIGHVAIYVGSGDVVEAPDSGAYIKVVPINQVEAGRIGVTRPLT